MQSSSSTASNSARSKSFAPWHREFSDTFSNSVDGDNWFEEVQRRFDERRKRWDEDVRRMREDFFTFGSDKLERSRTLPRLYVPHSGHRTNKPFSGNVKLNNDGGSYFTAKFDLTGFTPEEIRVSIRDGEVFVNALSEQVTEQGKSSREYSRSVTLPDTANESLADATLTPEGLLTFTCPLFSVASGRCVSPQISDSQSAFSPCSVNSAGSNHSSSYNGKRNRGDNMDRHSSFSSTFPKSKFCLELPIGTDYSPAEIHIRTLNRRIYVTAKHEERLPNRAAVREFSKEFGIPENVNPECLEARMENGILYIEAV